MKINRDIQNILAILFATGAIVSTVLVIRYRIPEGNGTIVNTVVGLFWAMVLKIGGWYFDQPKDADKKP